MNILNWYLFFQHPLHVERIVIFIKTDWSIFKKYIATKPHFYYRIRCKNLKEDSTFFSKTSLYQCFYIFRIQL